MKTLLQLSLLILSFSAFAQGDRLGGHDGGGGKGLICYDEKGNITSAELLDFFEGRTLEGLNIGDYPGDYKSIYNEVIKKSATQDILKTMSEGAKLAGGFKFLPKGIRLNSIDDSSEIFIPSNCKLEQVANFQGLSRIFIVKDFWDLLSETHKAGLLMHEFVWYLEREAGAKISSRARRTVARFFASDFNFEPYEIPLRNHRVCMAFNTKRRDNKHVVATEFHIAEIPGTKSCELTFETINGLPAFSKQTALLEDCGEWGFSESSWTRTDIGTGNPTYAIKVGGLEVMSPQESIVTHQLILLMNATYDHTNGEQTSKSYTLSVNNKEFPGFDDPESELLCHTVP